MAIACTRTPLPVTPAVVPLLPAAEELSPVPLPAAASIGPIDAASERHRRLFNAVAREYFDLEWARDDVNPHVPDLDAGEITVPAPSRAMFGMHDADAATPALAKAVEFVGEELERRRKVALEAVLAAQIPVRLAVDLQRLSAPNRQAVQKLLEAGLHIRELYKEQMLPNANAHIAAIIARGDPRELQVLKRNVVPLCGRYSPGPWCHLSPLFPDDAPPPDPFHWPKGMTGAKLAALSQASPDVKSDPILSPFTVAREGDNGTMTWQPFAKVPEFAPHLEAIARLLDETAAIEGLHPAFAEQLRAQATAFRSEEAYPYFASDAAWGKSAGELELTIGPYESYRDPWNVKAFFGFILGMEDPTLTAQLGKFMAMLPALETGLAGLAGKGYLPRTIPAAGIPLRVIETIAAFGDQNADGGPWSAYHLPNVGPMADAGQGKRVIMVNHFRAKFPITRAIADQALIPAQAGIVAHPYALYHLLLHELAHGLGPHAGLRIPRQDGAVSRLDLLLGKWTLPLEEAKADVVAEWALPLLQRAGLLTAEEVQGCAISFVAGLFTRLRYGLEEAHGLGAAMILHHLLAQGAVVPRGDRFAVEWAKYPAAVAALAAAIVRIQAAGDAAEAERLLTAFVGHSPPPLAAVLDRIGESKIPRDIAPIYYE